MVTIQYERAKRSRADTSLDSYLSVSPTRRELYTRSTLDGTPRSFTSASLNGNRGIRVTETSKIGERAESGGGGGGEKKKKTLSKSGNSRDVSRADFLHIKFHEIVRGGYYLIAIFDAFHF